jgi:ATP-dependent Clp protease, protease subunit
VSSYTIPNVVAQHPRGERIMDVYSHLLTERIVYLGTAVDPGVANTLIAQLIHLEWESTEQEINLYINCEGGDLPSMLALYDTMQYIQAPVATTCVGQAIAAGAVLLAAGAPGRRAMLPHARVVLHQPVDSGRGTIPDMILQADEIVRMRAEIESILSRHTGQTVQALRADTDRDRVLTAQAALGYGIVDQILTSRPLRRVDQLPGLGSYLAGRQPGLPTARAGAATGLGGEGQRGGSGPRGDDGPRGYDGLRDDGLRSDGLVLAEVTGYLLGQLGQRQVERASQGGDHLAGRLLAATLDLRQVLGRDPGPARRLRQRLALLPAQGAEAVPQDLAPQRLPQRGR